MSQPERYSKCLCQSCGGHIEFPTAGAGQTIDCPHCHWPVKLELAGAEAQSQRPGWLLTALIICAALVLVAAGAWWWLGRHPIPVQQPTSVAVPVSNVPPVVVAPKPPPDLWKGLMASAVKLEKTGDGRLVYAVGKLHNKSDHTRFAVKVDLDIFNGNGEKVGTATDYTPSIDAGKDWNFKALVVDRTAKKAKITAVTEN